MKAIYIGILAGGSGNRLWPLSKKDRPKQLIPFLGEKSLLQNAIERIKPLVPSKEHIFVVTNAQQVALVKQAAGNDVGYILAEPDARNTAAAMLLGTQFVMRKDPQALILFLTADHFIPDAKPFVNVLKKALDYVHDHQKIALFGIKPTYPATGYGYIQMNAAVDEGCFTVEKFHEKPTQELAQAYIDGGDTLWNMGIFAGQARVFHDECKTWVPALYEKMQMYLNYKLEYADLPSISIDYAVIEKSKNIVVFPGDFTWYDIGNLYTFLSLQKMYATQQHEIISIDAERNLANVKKKVVVCIGVSDLCIVETDDVLLIVQKDKVELVKNIASKVVELT